MLGNANKNVSNRKIIEKRFAELIADSIGWEVLHTHDTEDRYWLHDKKQRTVIGIYGWGASKEYKNPLREAFIKVEFYVYSYKGRKFAFRGPGVMVEVYQQTAVKVLTNAVMVILEAAGNKIKLRKK